MNLIYVLCLMNPQYLVKIAWFIMNDREYDDEYDEVKLNTFLEHCRLTYPFLYTKTNIKKLAQFVIDDAGKPPQVSDFITNIGNRFKYPLAARRQWNLE